MWPKPTQASLLFTPLTIVFQALKAFIEAKPSVYRKNMVDFIAIEFDEDVSLVTMSRTLQKEKISRKKVSLFTPFHSSITNVFC